MNWSSHTLWGHETPNVHSPSSWDTKRTGTNRDWSLPPLWNHNSSHERLWKCDVHMTSTSLSGDWMRLSLLHSHAHFSWSNNRISASSWFDWRPGISEHVLLLMLTASYYLLLPYLAERVRYEFAKICLVSVVAYIRIPLPWNWGGVTTNLYFKGCGCPPVSK